MAVKEVGKEREFGDFRHGGGNGEKGEAIRWAGSGLNWVILSQFGAFHLIEWHK